MQGCRVPVFFVTVFLLVYTLSPYLGIPGWIIACAYIASPLMVIWMVVAVLQNGKSSGRTFNKGYFYDHEDAPQSVDKDIKNAA